MVGPEDQTSSMYSTITRDSQMGLPSWIRTGIFLWTGFDSRRSWLLDPSVSSRNSYPADLILRAILGLITKGLGHAPISFTSLLAMIDNIKPNKVLRVCVFKYIWKKTCGWQCRTYLFGIGVRCENILQPRG